MNKQESKQTLIEYLFSKYPVDEKEKIEFKEICFRIQDKCPFDNTKEFVQFLSDNVEIHEGVTDDNQMTVRKSSTWAVCQQYLGNLTEDDDVYASSRGGIWSFDMSDITEPQLVSIRDIINDLEKNFG